MFSGAVLRSPPVPFTGSCAGPRRLTLFVRLRPWSMTQFFETGPARDSASDFLDRLRPSNDLWTGDFESHTGWVFRGQTSSRWKLRPAAYRFRRRDKLLQRYWSVYWKKYGNLSTEAWLKWLEPAIERPASLPEHIWARRIKFAGLQALVAGALVRDFVLYADRAGHPIRVPGCLWHITNRREHPEALRTLFHGGLEEADAAVFAIAQHHGVPTSFLDWTYNPLVAAFFASEPLAEVSAPEGEIAVWAIRTSLFRRDWKEIRRLTVQPRAVPFLDAQRGLFTWSPFAHESFLKSGRYAPFDALLGSLDATATEASYPLLRKVTLPAKFAAQLLKLLAREEVTRAHLMPTFDNVAATLRLQAMWKTEAS